jgi:CRP/FNR family transcriptional regulator, cyclic AMP receptor protein
MNARQSRSLQEDADPLAALPVSPALRSLAARAEPRRYRKGTLLIQEGDQGDVLYIVLTGRVRVFSIGTNDREITFGIYGPGDYVGEMSLDGGPRSANVMTIEASTCAVVTRQSLLDHIAQYPEFAFELLSKVIRRARAATLSTKQLALNDVYGRLRVLLESLAQTDETGARVILERHTHQELSHRLGCSREMVSRLMKDLFAGGYLSLEGSALHINRGGLPMRW